MDVLHKFNFKKGEAFKKRKSSPTVAQLGEFKLMIQK